MNSNELYVSDEVSQNSLAFRPDSAYNMDTSSEGPMLKPITSSDERQLYGILGAPSTSKESLLGSRRPKPKKMWKKRHVKLLVVGDSGLGKTTLVRCLLAVPGESMVLHDGSSTSFTEFKKDASKFQSSIEWEDAEDHVKWVYQIQDTPGYGDDLNLSANIDRVKQYITRQNQQWHSLESSANRGELAEAVDPRVDVCIFCLPPHRVRNIDMLFMWEISQLVPILPVVTKSDTMTIRECISYRAELSSKIQFPSLPGRRGPINLFTFSDDTLDACGLTDNAIASAAAQRPPYLVVCSNLYDESHLKKAEPELWPERRYMWGTSEAMNPQHSDLLLLRRLLLQEGVEEISRSKISRYEVWRKSELKQVRPIRKVLGYLATTAITLAVIAGVVAATGRVDVGSTASKVKSALKEKEEDSVEAPLAVAPVEEEPTASPGPTAEKKPFWIK